MTRERNFKGFTMIELAVVLAIVATIAAIAYTSLARMRPRASLTGTAAELTGLLYNARQNSLATGNYTVVMVFPQQANSSGGVGRVVAYEDPTFKFFRSGSALNFGNWDASRNPGTLALNLIGDVDLPRGVSFGLGGAAAPTLPAPYASVSALPCNFCSSSGDRGAIVFDSRGTARFYSAVGAQLSLPAGTLAITGSPEISGYHMLFITPTTGAVRPYVGG